MSSAVSNALLAAAGELSHSLARLSFSQPVAHVYNPLSYAWAPYQEYIERFGATEKRVVLLGMNPGPYGMMQTGVPFGEIAAVRKWMGIHAAVMRPTSEHPNRPIQGFNCRRSEVSGRRLWEWVALRFGAADAFFAEWFVLNYCPLVFLEASGRNITPDKLTVGERKAVGDLCDHHLAAALEALRPQWVIGIGRYAEKRVQKLLHSERMGSALADRIKIGQILHPSPTSPKANQGWSKAADHSLSALGLLPGQ